MNIRTIEDNFDYQVGRILKEFYPEYQKQKADGYDKSFSSYLWENAEDFGKAFFELIEEYMGMEEAINEARLSNE